MNHLKTDINGGFPAHLNDIRWSQNNLLSVLDAIHSGLINADETEYVFYSAPQFLGSGTVTVTAGWIFVYQELCYIPFHSYDETQEAAWWVVEDVFDGEGFKMFQNGVTHDTYLRRIAKLHSGPASSRPAGSPLFNRNTQIHLWKRMREKMLLQDVLDWRNLPDARYVTPVSQGRAQIYRDDSGFVHFRGNWNHDDPDSSFVIGTLPVGYRPELDIQFSYFNASSLNPATISAFVISISASTGVIDVQGDFFPQSFDMISFPTFKAVIS